METTSSIHVVGNYTMKRVGQEDCKSCQNADYGDVLIEGVCSKCLRSRLAECEKVLHELGNILILNKKHVELSDLEILASEMFGQMDADALAYYEAYKSKHPSLDINS